MAAAEETLAIAEKAESLFFGNAVGSASRSTLAIGGIWSLFGLKKSPESLSDAEIRREREDPEFERQQILKRLAAEESDPAFQAAVSKVFGGGLSLRDLLKPQALDPVLEAHAARSGKALFAGAKPKRWRYEFIPPPALNVGPTSNRVGSPHFAAESVVPISYPKSASLHRATDALFSRDDHPARWLVAEWADPSYPVSSINDANVILIPAAANLANLKLSRFRFVHENFLDDFDVERRIDRSQPPPTLWPAVYTTVHNADGTEIVTRFIFQEHSMQLIGEARLVSTDPKTQSTILATELAQYPKGTRILFYGDDLKSININRLADKAGVDLFRRSPAVRKPLIETQARVKQLASRSLDPASTTFVNGLPADAAAVQTLGPFAGSVDSWLTARQVIDDATKDIFPTSIQGKDAFFEELLNGQKDAVYVIAHSDGTYLYLGADRISLYDIEQLEPRLQPSSRPRLAVLAICDAGRITGAPPIGLLAQFRSQARSLAEILVSRGYFDEVIAPDHVIEGPEALSAIIGHLNGLPIAEIRKSFAGWNKSVSLHTPDLLPTAPATLTDQ